MKSYIKFFAWMALAAATTPVFTSCDEEKSEPPLPIPEGIYNENGEIGLGTWEVPLTCYQARLGTLPAGMSDNVWVSGYIVGWINSDLGASMKQETCMFTSPSSVKSNVLLSDYTPAELEAKFVEKDAEGNIISDTRWKNCVVVQLVYDTDPRPAINLSDNPGNLGKRLSIMGETHVAYFGVYGVKNTSAYNWGEQGKIIPPAVPGTFTKTDTFVPDHWYLIVGNGNQAGKVFDSARSYLATSEVTVSSGTIRVKNMNVNGFYFEDAGEGVVRIKEANGLYLCNDGTDIAFHTTDNPSSSNCLFTIADNGNGFFTIKAKSTGATMMYDTQYGSFGLYTSIGANHVYPELYIK